MKFSRSIAAQKTPISLFDLLGHSDEYSDGILLQLSNREATVIETVLDIPSDTLGGTHFLINSPDTAYYVWFDVDNGSADPSIAGRTGIEVDISSGDTANDVAAALQAILNAHADFVADAQSNIVFVSNVDGGNAPNTIDTDTGFTIETVYEGSSNVFYGSPNGANIRLTGTIILPSGSTKSIFISGTGTLIVGLF